ncbi:precorrin-2 dehydrogenase/sirohydrochlorin ferrochelatase family protein [Viridibacillus sp. NPDC096237]|uniref:precorrin-2 dehydrogenase/sirohydrochlorin ferrochelatase family protein n=1 Tax=Viridibacillus sp. NPDC096237 TaxID=3390721 RepID=UPI003D032BFE
MCETSTPMTTYYPIMLQIKDKRCVVIGGGKVANRKVTSLLVAGANVTVISPVLDEKLREKWQNHLITWHDKFFEASDLQNAFCIIAATNCPSVNAKVKECALPHQLVNIVDEASESNFIVPASLRRGDLTIAVSTAGANPGLAKKVKDDLTHQFDDYYGEYVAFLQKARTDVLANVSDVKEKKTLLDALLQPEFLTLTKEGKITEREELLQHYLKRGIAPWQ